MPNVTGSGLYYRDGTRGLSSHLISVFFCLRTADDPNPTQTLKNVGWLVLFTRAAVGERAVSESTKLLGTYVRLNGYCQQPELPDPGRSFGLLEELPSKTKTPLFYFRHCISSIRTCYN